MEPCDQNLNKADAMGTSNAQGFADALLFISSLKAAPITNWHRENAYLSRLIVLASFMISRAVDYDCLADAVKALRVEHETFCEEDPELIVGIEQSVFRNEASLMKRILSFKS